MEKMRSVPRTVTIPPSRTCTTSARSKSLRIPIVEDNTATGVLGEWTVGDDVSQAIAKGTEAVWTIVGGVAEAAAKEQ